MVVDANIAPDAANRTDASAVARCPHVVFRNVLGTAIVAELLDFVAARKNDFRSAVVRNRETGERRVDYGLRNCGYLGDVGTFETPVKAFVCGIAERTMAKLHLTQPIGAPSDFEIAAYGNGAHFGPHIDTDERLERVRILSCVYYFAATPRRFEGGELRLYGLPTLSAKDAAAPPFTDIVPETDTLVAFPSWLRHEVRPVRVPSGEWADGRFTINCWVHRRNPVAGDVSGGN